eukprot:119561-Pleurochrysis_carterae.AAC.2
MADTSILARIAEAGASASMRGLSACAKSAEVAASASMTGESASARSAEAVEYACTAGRKGSARSVVADRSASMAGVSMFARSAKTAATALTGDGSLFAMMAEAALPSLRQGAMPTRRVGGRNNRRSAASAASISKVGFNRAIRTCGSTVIAYSANSSMLIADPAHSSLVIAYPVTTCGDQDAASAESPVRPDAAQVKRKPRDGNLLSALGDEGTRQPRVCDAARMCSSNRVSEQGRPQHGEITPGASRSSDPSLHSACSSTAAHPAAPERVDQDGATANVSFREEALSGAHSDDSVSPNSKRQKTLTFYTLQQAGMPPVIAGLPPPPPLICIGDAYDVSETTEAAAFALSEKDIVMISPEFCMQ